MALSLINVIEIESSPYLFDISLSCDTTHAGISQSDNKVSIRNVETFSEVITIADHTDTITSVEYSKTSPQMIHTASMDRRMCIWDTRSPSVPAFMIAAQGEVTATAMGLDDSLLASGVGADICFYDVRSGGRPLGMYSDCHTDIVCSLAFHPTTSSLLQSGGEDGLVCIFNTAAAAQVCL